MAILKSDDSQLHFDEVWELGISLSADKRIGTTKYMIVCLSSNTIWDNLV